ncbi:MAG: YdcF family protein, partial [Christensenellales bacterium]
MGKIKLAWHIWGRWLCLAAAGVLAMGFLALYLVVWIKSGEEDDAVPSDCIVVLGAKAHGLEPGRVLRARLEQAQKAYEQGLGGKILVCGGKGTDETVPEAAAMAAYLKAQGVPDEDI